MPSEATPLCWVVLTGDDQRDICATAEDLAQLVKSRRTSPTMFQVLPVFDPADPVLRLPADALAVVFATRNPAADTPVALAV